MRSNINDGRYEKFDQVDDFESYSETLIQQAQKMNIPIDTNPSRVKQLVKSDLRDVIPSRIFELVGRIVTAVESASESEGKK